MRIIKRVALVGAVGLGLALTAAAPASAAPVTTAKGCVTHELYSEPGSVNAAERTLPPGVSEPSSNKTDLPACAIRMAAAIPFGPEPTTMTSLWGRSSLEAEDTGDDYRL